MTRQRGEFRSQHPWRPGRQVGQTEACNVADVVAGLSALFHRLFVISFLPVCVPCRVLGFTGSIGFSYFLCALCGLFLYRYQI